MFFFDIDLPANTNFQGADGLGWSKVEGRSKPSPLTQYSVLTRRSFVNMYRDVGYYWFRFTIQLSIALSLGTLFYHLGYAYESIQVCPLSSILTDRWLRNRDIWYEFQFSHVYEQARGSMILFISAFSTYMVVGSFPSFGEDMKVPCKSNNLCRIFIVYIPSQTLILRSSFIVRVSLGIF